jgi:hypothetical protein
MFIGGMICLHRKNAGVNPARFARPAARDRFTQVRDFTQPFYLIQKGPQQEYR